MKRRLWLVMALLPVLFLLKGCSLVYVCNYEKGDHTVTERSTICRTRSCSIGFGIGVRGSACVTGQLCASPVKQNSSG
jgi:hypothetical protein